MDFRLVLLPKNVTEVRVFVSVSGATSVAAPMSLCKQPQWVSVHEVTYTST
jgi:hypothetical protein